MMKKLILIIIVAATGFLCAQDPKVDFKKINEKYYGLEKISMNVNYELFFDNDQQYTEREEGFYKRHKDQYFVKQAGNEMLITEKYMIMIDNEYKTVLLESSRNNVNPLNPLQLDLDSIMDLYEKIDFYRTGENDALSAYTFTLKRGLYSKIEVVFDPVTLLIKEITNTYREKMPDQNDKPRTARLKTSFSDIKTNQVFTKDFDESKYIVSSDKKLKLTKKYKDYKLLTYLKKL